ncbi:hypothetical protein [Phenylobacterium sp.]|uniref:hypothetical protein n=1 Tax=Phenylobacterium sp. TaxID=1871053 RepID=UPI0025D54A37|nr:hypothetical protein [Phenylobacterium sp.]
MTGRNDKIYQEAAALWRQLHSEPPPDGADGAMVLDLILGRLPPTGYDRLTTPHLRPSNIAFPQHPRT